MPESSGMQPEESLALAREIALRSSRFDALFEKIFASLQGESYKEKTTEQLIDMHIGRTALYLAQVENPDKPISITDQMDAAYGNKGYTRLAADMGEGDTSLFSAESARLLSHAYIDEMQRKLGISDEQYSQRFAERLTVAREVAAENGVDVATVYAQDDLYFQVVRKIHTPSESADEYAKAIEVISSNTITDVFVRSLEQMIPEDMREELSPEDMTELAVELQLDPALQGKLAELMETIKEAARQAVVISFTQIYGIKALRELSTVQKYAIMPRRPLVEEAFDNR